MFKAILFAAILGMTTQALAQGKSKEKPRVVTVEEVNLVGEIDLVASLKKKHGDLTYYELMRASKTDRCKFSPERYRQDCYDLESHFIGLGSETGTCKKIFNQRYMAEKCEKAQAVALRAGHGPNVLKNIDFKHKIYDRMAELSLKACENIEKESHREQCKKDFEERKSILEYQEACYSDCMPKKFREECLHLGKDGEDLVLTREIKAHAYVGQCRFISNQDYREECEEINKAMLNYEARGQNCENFNMAYMRDLCEAKVQEMYPDAKPKEDSSARGNFKSVPEDVSTPTQDKGTKKK